MAKKKEGDVKEIIAVAEKDIEKAVKKARKINPWMISTIVLAIALIAYFVFGSSVTGNAISSTAAGEKAISLLNKYFVQDASVELDSVIRESSLYKITTSYQGQKIPVYLTLDGKLLVLPGAGVIDIAELEQKAKERTQDTTPAQTGSGQGSDVPKTDKPSVELFVMSHCPYGTQVEKGILPVVNLLKDKIDFKVRFVFYAMHGKTEVDEELRQYCIQKEQPEKFLNYLSYFLEKGDSSDALTRAKIDVNQLNSCITKADTDFEVTKKYNDKGTWLNGKYPQFDADKVANIRYDVGGSPTLVINGATVQGERDSASLLKAICSAFSSAPAECNSKLSAETPSVGFGNLGAAPGTEHASGSCS